MALLKGYQTSNKKVEVLKENEVYIINYYENDFKEPILVTTTTTNEQIALQYYKDTKARM